MKLYDAAWAPSPRRVRIYLAEKGIDVERVQIDLRSDQQLSPEFLAINPRGTVPVLVLDNGTVIDESSAICRYFEALQPDNPLFGSNAEQIALIEAWTRRIEHDCYGAVAAVFRNTIAFLKDRPISGKWPPMPQIPELARRGQTMFTAFMVDADTRLSQSRFIAGETYSFADITLQVALDFAQASKLVPDSSLVHMHRWLAEVRQRKSAEA